MELIPSPDYRTAFRRGMKGTDVAALQINLPPLVVDGDFGPKTELAVERIQASQDLETDGIAGVLTQKAICRVGCGPVRKELDLPSGVLLSMVSNESSFLLAAYTIHYDKEGNPTKGFDLGPFQRSFPTPGIQSEYEEAYSVPVMARRSGTNLRNRHDVYFQDGKIAEGWYLANIADEVTNRLAWQLAVLAHNWPEAAEHIAFHGSIYDNPTFDTQPVKWVEAATRGRLRTPREWVVSYIERATVYVRWST